MAANTQPQSTFTKLPPVIRISIYEYILVRFRGPDTNLIGPLLPCRQMNMEVENEMTQAIYRNLHFAVEAIQSDFNKQQFPPVKVNLLPYVESLKHNAITLDLVLPNSAFTSSWDIIQCMHRSIFPPLSRFNLASFNISFFNDDAYNPKRMWLPFRGIDFEYHFLRLTYPQRYQAPPPTRLQRFCLDIDLGSKRERRDCLYMWVGICRHFHLEDSYDIEYETSDGQKHVKLHRAGEVQTQVGGGSIQVTCTRKDP